MAELIEITVWAAGVIQDSEGRDIAKCIAAAAAKEGKNVQAFDNYADLPDRVNVPVRKYARISDEEIAEKYQYENHNPNVVILLESTFIKGYNVLKGMAPGGTLVVNTNKNPEEILSFLPDESKELLNRVVTVDGWSISPKLEGTAGDMSDGEGALGASQLGSGIGAVIAGATAKGVDCFKLDSLEAEVVSPNLARQGYEKAKVIDL